MHHAAAGLAVDEGEMADRGIGRERRRNRTRVGPLALADREAHHRPPALAREPGEPARIAAGHRHEELPPARHEGADRGLDRKVPRALQRQARMRLPAHAGERQQKFAHSGVERVEVAVPRREIVRERRADLGASGHGARNHEFHHELHVDARRVLEEAGLLRPGLARTFREIQPPWPLVPPEVRPGRAALL